MGPTPHGAFGFAAISPKAWPNSFSSAKPFGFVCAPCAAPPQQHELLRSSCLTCPFVSRTSEEAPRCRGVPHAAVLQSSDQTGSVQ